MRAWEIYKSETALTLLAGIRVLIGWPSMEAVQERQSKPSLHGREPQSLDSESRALNRWLHHSGVDPANHYRSVHMPAITPSGLQSDRCRIEDGVPEWNGTDSGLECNRMGFECNASKDGCRMNGLERAGKRDV